jgi:mRNA-degrading endonuclease RelE of RelBE toxin-antitoxin system
VNKYEVKPSKFFLKQLEGLNLKTIELIYSKLELLEINPKRNKSLNHSEYNLLRIRLTSSNKEIRIVYTIKEPLVKVLFILDRSKKYKDLDKLIKKMIEEGFL